MNNKNHIVLEEAAKKFTEDTANPPYLFDLEPAEGRVAVDEVQSSEIDKLPVEENEFLLKVDRPIKYQLKLFVQRTALQLNCQ